MKLSEIRAALQDRRPSVVAKATGLHRNVIARVRDGKHATTPAPETVQILAAYLRGHK